MNTDSPVFQDIDATTRRQNILPDEADVAVRLCALEPDNRIEKGGRNCFGIPSKDVESLSD